MPKRRPGPVGPCDDATVEHIKKAIAETIHRRGLSQDLGPFALFRRPQLARTGARLMRENGLLAPHRLCKRPDKAHDGTITTEAVDVMWGTDMTQGVTLAEGVAHVFVAVDHCNSECVGIHADKSANRFQATGPPGCAPALRCHRQGRGRRPRAPARPRTELHVRRLPERDRLPRHRGLAVLRAPARGQRGSRALHPYTEGKPLVGAPLRDHRGVAPGCSISPPGTIPTGWSPAMATGHLLRSGPTSNRPSIRPHERCSRLSHNRDAVYAAHFPSPHPTR